jgi:glycolate oxidase
MSPVKNLRSTQEALAKIIGAERVSLRNSYFTVSPKTTEEISQILKLANRLRIPVSPRGGGTAWWSSTRPKAGGIMIRMNRMDQVLFIDEDSMTVTVEAGITFSDLEAKLGEKGYRIVISPESGRIATMGGHIETWGTSPYSSSFFEDQDTQLVGLKVVLPTGEIVQTGSGALTTAAGNFARRFFPSDLTGLFIGAESAFGIITEATLKMYKRAEKNTTRMIGFPDLASATAALRKIQEAQRSGGLATIAEQRFMSKKMLYKIIPRLEGKISVGAEVFLSIRGEGEAADVEHHFSRIRDITAEGGVMIEDEVPEWWEGHFGLIPGTALGKGPRVMLVAYVPMGKFLEVEVLAEEFGKSIGIQLSFLGYPISGPIILAHTIIAAEHPAIKTRTRALSQGRKLMEAMMKMGCVPHRVGTDFLPLVTKKLSPEYYGLVKKIKKLLDPRGILRPEIIEVK